MSQRTMRVLRCALSFAVISCVGCAGSNNARRGEGGRSDEMEGSSRPEDDQGRCDTRPSDRETSEYDTSGDDYADVRRVFRRVGDPPLIRLVLTCREADLNADGVKDVVRYYNDEGRPLREEADRNFDGTMDSVTFYQDGRVVRQEQDSNADGRVDTKIYFERGRMVRTERDVAGRSTASRWRPDRWEYFEDGRMIRMGTDVDGDGNVDHWDRDSEWNEARRREDNDQTVEDAVTDTPDPDEASEPAAPADS